MNRLSQLKITFVINVLHSSPLPEDFDPILERLPEAQLKNLGRAIARLRVTAGLTQEKLAEKSKINTRYLQALEAGDFGGSLAVLWRVKKALACTWDELLGGL